MPLLPPRLGTAISLLILIAATALANDIPLVTNNKGHFSRIPGLQLLIYGSV